MIRGIAITTIVIIAALLAWEYFASTSDRVSFFLSRPTEIFSVWWQEANSISYWNNVTSTMAALICGYILAILIGYVIGLFSYFLKNYNISADNALTALGSVPVFALAPILILALGSGFPTRVGVVVLSSVFLIGAGVYQAAKFSDETYGSIFRDLKISRGELWRRAIVPGALVYAIPSLKGAVALSVIGVFVAEWISSERGLGRYILSAMSLFDSPRLMIGIGSFMIITMFVVYIITIIERKTLSWRNFR